MNLLAKPSARYFLALPVPKQHAMSRFLLLFFVCSTTYSAVLQTPIVYQGDIAQLALEITKGSSTDAAKLEAITLWVAQNIRYDWRLYNKSKAGKIPKTTIKCKSSTDCDEARQEYYNKLVIKTLRTGKGVCEHYARVEHALCRAANIQSEVVTGKARNIELTRSFGYRNTYDSHAWNAVFIDSTWYFVDATWASGTCTRKRGKLTGFKLKLNRDWLLAAPAEMRYDHLPDSIRRWSYPDTTWSKTRFRTSPFYHRREAGFHFETLTPEANLRANKGDTVSIRLPLLPNSPEGLPSKVQIVTKKYTAAADIHRAADTLIVTHILPRRVGWLFVVIDAQPIYYRVRR